MIVRIDARSGIAIGAALILVVGAAVDVRSTLAAYLVAWIAVSAIPIGALGVLMTSYLVRRAWTDPARMTRAASIGLMIYAPAVSLAGVDWMESLEPDFHSSIYGLLFLSFVLLAGIAFAIAGGLVLRRRIGPIRGYSALLLS